MEKNYKSNYRGGVNMISKGYADRAIHKAHKARRNAEKRLKVCYVIISILAAMLLVEVGYTSREIDKLESQANELKIECEILKSRIDNNFSSDMSIDPMSLTTLVEKEESIEEPKVITLSNSGDNLPDKYNSVPLSEDLKNYIYNSAKEAGIPAEIMFAMAWKESTFNPNAKSGTSDHGLFQINTCNFARLAKEFGYTYSEFCEKIYDPYVNTDCSIYILKEYKNNYKNDNWHHLLMRYNMGPGGAAKNFKNGVYSSKYSRAIIDYAATNFGLGDISIS